MNDLKLLFEPPRDVAVATNSGEKSTSIPHLVVRVAFGRAAPPAYDKKGGAIVMQGAGQTNYLIRWMQANQLSKVINRRRGG